MEPEATQKKPSARRLLKNRFIIGMVIGFAIGLIVDNLLVGITLLAVLSIAWYVLTQKQNREPEEEDA